MRVFISWSGDRSKAIAEVLADWLPKVIQALEPWISGEIDKGANWNQEIGTNLEHSKVGIICLNPDNLESPWINFEAGAISKTKDALACTFLVGLEPTDVKAPLGMFQHTTFKKDEIRKLLGTLNGQLESCQEKPLPEKRLDDIFETNWPALEASLTAQLAHPPAKARKQRSERDLLEEILEIVRSQQRQLPPDTRGLVIPPRTSGNAGLSLDEALNARIYAMDPNRVGLDSLFSSTTKRELEESIGALNKLSEQARKAEIFRHLTEKAAKKGMLPPADADDQKKD